MKNTIIVSLITYHLSLITASAAVPLKWTVETSRLAPAVFDVVRGETIALEAAFNSAGKPFAMDGEPVSVFWQTNGMGNAWWTAPAVATSNLVRATFTPEMDPGAATVNGFLGSSGSIYRAAFTFRFRHGPGAVPNTLPLPVPVIDFAKVRVLNPPWSGGGGGGGVDTNAVKDIIRETVDGEGRYLPKYLHYREMDDTYPEAAAEWYVQADYSHGSCSALRIGNLFERNYDWNFNDMPEYVIRIPAGPGRFASLAVYNVGTNLTEADVTSGKHLRWLKALPGHAVDGINSEGVVAEVNVVDGEPQWGSGVPPLQPIHPLGAVRWVLDHATNAQHGAEYIAANIRFPEGWTQNFHYMIADATSTWIVENGHAYNSGEAASSPLVLTNFRLYPTRDTSGEGQERYDALVSGANITSQWWTLTYTPQGYRASDLPGITGEALNQLFDYWASKPREAHRGEKFHSTTTPSDYDYTWWQTVHTSVYDITNRVLRVAVQETDDWYTFAVPSAGGVKPEAGRFIVEPLIGAPTNALTNTLHDSISKKRDKRDRVVYREVSEWTHGEVPSGFGLLYTQPKWSDVYDAYEWEAIPISLFAFVDKDFYGETVFKTVDDMFQMSATATRSIDPTSAKLAHTSKLTAGGLAKFGADGELEEAEPSGTSADPASADYRDPTDNTCHNTEFGEWVCTPALPEGVSIMCDDDFSVGFGWAPFRINAGVKSKLGAAKGDINSTELTWQGSDDWTGSYSFTATRSAVCTDGKKFVTSDIVDGKVSAAVSTNNPAFVSAVRSLMPTTLRAYDPVRQCWWKIQPVNGVITLTVED